MVLSTTRLLAITKIVPGGISGMKLSPLYPLLITSLTAMMFKACNASSYSQGILESASTPTFSLPLLKCNLKL